MAAIDGPAGPSMATKSAMDGLAGPLMQRETTCGVTKLQQCYNDTITVDWSWFQFSSRVTSSQYW